MSEESSGTGSSIEPTHHTGAMAATDKPTGKPKTSGVAEWPAEWIENDVRWPPSARG